MIVASITNVCNLRCLHCYYPKFAQDPGYHAHMMEWEIWTKICDEMARYPWSILNLGTDGEPLLHPRFLEMLRYARAKKIFPVNVTTNGIPLNREMTEALVRESLLDVVNISLDAHSPEKYRVIRGANAYEKVRAQILDLIELRNRSKAPLKIQVNIIDQPEVREEIPAFVDDWKSKVDNVMVRTYYDATAFTGATGPDVSGKQKEFDPIERWPCQQFWRRLNIADDGVVRFCVDDWFNKTRVGDLHDSTIGELWRGEAYERLRRLHLEKKTAEIPYCSKCTEWQGMRWDYDYFTALEKMLGKKIL
jgi:MoaA/NifB/PqqE/SkfB family radical SAM enzyme